MLLYFFSTVYTLAQLFKLNSNSVELSALARRGSGSACRSLFEGFVRWHKEGPCSAQPIAMEDSNQFQPVCLDIYPPLFYLNRTSQAIIQLVHRYNNSCGEPKVAYTFDTGPNTVLVMQDADLEPFAALFCFLW
jgi:mevalonate pyrophosphate decarboxylase